MDSCLGRKMSICCSHLCAMLQAFNLWHICNSCHPQKRSSKPINGHKTIFSLDCTLMLLVSKLPIELNHSTKWKWYRICVKKNQNLQKENMVLTWVWLKMTSDNIFASTNLLSCRILETGTIIFLSTQTHPYSAATLKALCWVLSISSVYRLVKFANSEEEMCFM